MMTGLPQPPSMHISVGMRTQPKTVIEWQEVEHQWEALRPRVGSYWSRLPADELSQLAGDRESLVRLVRRYYALDTTEAERQVSAWVAGLSWPRRLG
jgi:hypothetical protein